MSVPEDSSSDTGMTVELELQGSQARLPATAESFREQLPGLEPDRHLTDWGRSERIEGLVDRTLYDFFFHYWYRVEVEGVDNVPNESGALLVANRSAGVPADGVMIAKALREEHARRRTVHLISEQNLTAIPGIGMLARKLGAVTDHPANLHRLLFDERQLVLFFPEGRPATRKPLKERYRMRSFQSGCVCRVRRSRRRANRARRSAWRRGSSPGDPGPRIAAPVSAESLIAAAGEVQDPLSGAGQPGAARRIRPRPGDPRADPGERAGAGGGTAKRLARLRGQATCLRVAS